ncbi:MAG: YlmC/YmxH family sporulation protein [Bacillota bacterium]
MKLSELIGKEIVNIYDGARLGTIGDSDLIIDSASGIVDAIIIPGKNGLSRLFANRGQMIIPWESVKKIGDEVIIVEMDRNNKRQRKM